MAIHLIRPSMDYRKYYMAFYDNWISSGEDIIPWGWRKTVRNSYQIQLGCLTPFTGWRTRIIILGAVNTRHRPNQKLLNSGGHIGCGIAPFYRRRGYASAHLAETLQITKSMGLEKVLLVCDKGNIGSERTILKNGGVFESEYTEEDGNMVRRFWVPLQRYKGER